MNTNRFRIALCFSFIIPAFLPAQTAGRLNALLESAGVNYAETAMLILPAAGLAGEDVSAETAFEEARTRGFLPKNVRPGGAVRLGDLAFFMMRAFDMKGGLFYTLFPGPRYAYREFVHLKLIQGRNDPALTVSGERLLRILGRVLDRHLDRSESRGYL
jgi:hypothetical protein